MVAKKFLTLFLLVIALFINACTSKKVVVDPSTEKTPVTEAAPAEERRMDNFLYLKKCLNGSFSSEEQHAKSNDFFDIRMRMVPIWKSSDNVFYLYVEQSMAATVDNPFNQQVYKVVKDDNTHSTIYVYSIPDAQRFAGKKEGDYTFETFDQEVVIEKVGCEIKLEFATESSAWAGSTGEKACAGESAGIAWTSSDLIAKDDLLEVWNRSWDSTGKQVKGSTKGAYIFRKIE